MIKTAPSFLVVYLLLVMPICSIFYLSAQGHLLDADTLKLMTSIPRRSRNYYTSGFPQNASVAAGSSQDRSNSQRTPASGLQRFSDKNDNTISVLVYPTYNCDNWRSDPEVSEVSSFFAQPGECTAANTLTAYVADQSITHVRIFCSAITYSSYMIGYSDSNCTKIVYSIKFSSESNNCHNYFKVYCPLYPNNTLPDFPSFPPPGHLVISDCESGDCSGSCASISYLPNVCRTVRLGADQSLLSSRTTYSSDSNQMILQVFSDEHCSTLHSMSLTPVGVCKGYPSSKVEIPTADVPTGTLPAFPPPNSVVFSFNCSDSTCSGDCVQNAEIVGSCSKLDTPNYLRLKPIHSITRYCLSDDVPALAVFSDFQCSDVNAVYGGFADKASYGCHLVGNSFEKMECSQSSTASQPQLPSSLDVVITNFAASDTMCIGTNTSIFVQSQGCVPTFQSYAQSFRIDCSNPFLAVESDFYGQDCVQDSSRGTESYYRGECQQSMITCPLAGMEDLYFDTSDSAAVVPIEWSLLSCFLATIAFVAEILF